MLKKISLWEFRYNGQETQSKFNVMSWGKDKAFNKETNSSLYEKEIDYGSHYHQKNEERDRNPDSSSRSLKQ